MLTDCRTPAQILRALPFFSNVPEALFDEIMAAGQLVTYQAGEVIWTPTSAKQKAAAACASLVDRLIDYKNTSVD